MDEQRQLLEPLAYQDDIPDPEEEARPGTTRPTRSCTRCAVALCPRMSTCRRNALTNGCCKPPQDNGCIAWPSA